FFFFQAEDGIRDRNVTGVQTCALPISSGPYCTQPCSLVRIRSSYGAHRFCSVLSWVGSNFLSWSFTIGCSVGVWSLRSSRSLSPSSWWHCTATPHRSTGGISSAQVKRTQRCHYG